MATKVLKDHRPSQGSVRYLSHNQSCAMMLLEHQPVICNCGGSRLQTSVLFSCAVCAVAVSAISKRSMTLEMCSKCGSWDVLYINLYKQNAHYVETFKLFTDQSSSSSNQAFFSPSTAVAISSGEASIKYFCATR